MKALIAAMLIVMSACAGDIQPFAGLSMGYGKPVLENKMYDPHGRFGIRYVTQYVEIEASHISSIPNPFDAWGINLIGAQFRTTEHSGYSAFVGYAKNLTPGKDYIDELSGDMLRVGGRYDLHGNRLFIDGAKVRDVYMGSFGVEWLF